MEGQRIVVRPQLTRIKTRAESSARVFILPGAMPVALDGQIRPPPDLARSQLQKSDVTPWIAVECSNRKHHLQ
jgi:hypothetical protein